MTMTQSATDVSPSPAERLRAGFTPDAMASPQRIPTAEVATSTRRVVAQATDTLVRLHTGPVAALDDPPPEDAGRLRRVGMAEARAGRDRQALLSAHRVAPRTVLQHLGSQTAVGNRLRAHGTERVRAVVPAYVEHLAGRASEGCDDATALAAGPGPGKDRLAQRDGRHLVIVPGGADPAAVEAALQSATCWVALGCRTPVENLPDSARWAARVARLTQHDRDAHVEMVLALRSVFPQWRTKATYARTRRHARPAAIRGWV